MEDSIFLLLEKTGLRAVITVQKVAVMHLRHQKKKNDATTLVSLFVSFCLLNSFKNWNRSLIFLNDLTCDQLDFTTETWDLLPPLGGIG